MQTLFDDGKSPDALRTIGEVAKALGIRQHVLRYWEEQFPMLKPVKRSGGRRYYRPEDVELISFINQLVQEEGYTLRGARQAIIARAEVRAEPAKSVEPVGVSASNDLERLLAIREMLAGALRAA